MPPASAAVPSRSSADSDRAVTLKVLIVSDRPDFRQLLAHHVTLEWRDALPAEYEPTTRGRLQPGFTGAAYDAVLLDQEVQGGRGLEWLEDLVERRDCPAIVYFAADIDDDASTRARECGAAHVFARGEFGHVEFVAALRTAYLSSKTVVK